MVNRRAKGKLLTAKAKAILEKEDYLVEVARPKLMFIGPGKMITREEDFWGVADLICLHDVLNPRLIQVSVWDARSAKIEQVKGFAGKHPNIAPEIWLWFSQGKNGHFRICLDVDSYEWRGKCELPNTKKRLSQVDVKKLAERVRDFRPVKSKNLQEDNFNKWETFEGLGDGKTPGPKILEVKNAKTKTTR